MEEIKEKPRSRIAEPPEDSNKAEKSSNWRSRSGPISKMPGIEVVMTKRPEKKKVAFKQPEVTKEIASEEPIKEREIPTKEVREDSEPVLPYRDVPAITHVRNSDVQKSKENIPIVYKEKAYKLRSPIEDEAQGESAYDALMRSEVTLTVARLIETSPEVAKRLRIATTKTRRPLKHKAAMAFLQESEFPYMEDDVECHLEFDAIRLEDLPGVSSLYISTEEDERLDPRVKAGNMIVPDPYLQYLAELDGKTPRQVFVANDSAGLRVIFPFVNAKGKTEAVIDSGSQIVSMALSEAEELGIGWDPDIQIYMQSANGQLKKSAGLARNVPFVFGDITVYLQVHIIDKPAYKVLLGRPFDILTESQINNSANGGQVVTLRDPNTGRRCTLPTMKRGSFIIPRNPIGTDPGESRSTSSLPSRQSDFRKAKVEEVRDESEEGEESDEESEDEGPDFHRSSKT